MRKEKLTGSVIGAAIKVHRNLGPGLLESAYQECLLYELKKMALKTICQKSCPIIYDELKLDHGYRIDLLVEDQLVLELKTVDQLSPVHTAQLLTYMKLGKYPLGLLINFNVKILKDGIRRHIMSEFF